MLHLPVIAALADRGEPARTREAIYNVIGNVQFPDMLLERDAATNYSEALLGHRAQSTSELVALYGGLLAHGTDVDARGVAAMIPGLEPSQGNEGSPASRSVCVARSDTSSTPMPSRAS